MYNRNNLMKKSLFILTVLIFFFNNKVFSQYTEIINSNRPGSSQSAFSVGSNVIQLETGVFLLNQEHELLQNKANGAGLNFMVRYGLILEELALQINGTYQNDEFTDMRSTLENENNRLSKVYHFLHNKLVNIYYQPTIMKIGLYHPLFLKYLFD